MLHTLERLQGSRRLALLYASLPERYSRTSAGGAVAASAFRYVCNSSLVLFSSSAAETSDGSGGASSAISSIAICNVSDTRPSVIWLSASKDAAGRATPSCDAPTLMPALIAIIAQLTASGCFRTKSYGWLTSKPSCLPIRTGARLSSPLAAR